MGCGGSCRSGPQCDDCIAAQPAGAVTPPWARGGTDTYTAYRQAYTGGGVGTYAWDPSYTGYMGYAPPSPGYVGGGYTAAAWRNRGDVAAPVAAYARNGNGNGNGNGKTTLASYGVGKPAAGMWAPASGMWAPAGEIDEQTASIIRASIEAISRQVNSAVDAEQRRQLEAQKAEYELQLARLNAQSGTAKSIETAGGAVGTGAQTSNTGSTAGSAVGTAGQTSTTSTTTTSTTSRSMEPAAAPQQPAAGEMTTGTKVAIGVGVVAVLGTIGYFVWKSQKPRKNPDEALYPHGVIDGEGIIVESVPAPPSGYKTRVHTIEEYQPYPSRYPARR